MKKIVLYLFLLYMMCISTNIYADPYTHFSGELPSEQTQKQINEMSQVSQDHPSLRAGGPPGSDTGSGGAVGTPIGDASILHILVILGTYVLYITIKKRKQKKNSEY